MEKGNEAVGGPAMGTGPKIASGAGTEGGGVVAGGARSGAATGTLSGTETGTGTAAAPPPFSEPVPPPPGEAEPGTGGGGATSQRWRSLPAQEGESADGSKLRLDGEGGAEYQEGDRTVRLEGDRWVDPTTGQPAAPDLADRAGNALGEIEEQLRLNPPR